MAEPQKSVMAERRLYIVKVERGIQQKRFFLEGDDTDEAKAQLSTVIGKLASLADSSPDWLTFLQEVSQEFLRAGFVPTAH